MYAVYFTGPIHHGYDWMHGKLINQTAFGVTIEDNRGERHTFPSHVIQKMTARNGW